MTFPRGLAALAFVAASGFLGCGQESSKGNGGAPAGTSTVGAGTAAPADTDLAHLVPQDAFGVLYVPSIDALDAKVKAIVGSIDADAAKSAPVADALQGMFGPAFEQVDLSGPIAIAISPGDGEKAPPAPTFIVAVRDGAAAKRAFGEPQPGQPVPVLRGRFLALSTSPGFAPGFKASALLDGLPAGDLAVRIDLARAVATFRTQIDGMFDRVRDADLGTTGPGASPRPPSAAGSAEAMKSTIAAIQEFLNSAERLDLGIRLEGTVANLDVVYTAKEGGRTVPSADVDLAGLAACLPKEYPIAGLISIRFEDLMKWSSSLMEATIAAMPEASRDAFRKMMAQSMEMYALLDPGMAMGMSMGASGIEGVGVSSAKDPKALLAKMDDMLKGEAYRSMAEGMGSRIETLPTTTVDGVEVRGLKMTFDWAKVLEAGAQGKADPRVTDGVKRQMESVFGADGMKVRTSVVGKRILYTFGGDDALMAGVIAAAKDPARKGSPELSKALAKLGGKPSFLVRIELRAFLEGLAGFMQTMRARDGAQGVVEGPRVPAGAPVPLLVFGAADGRVYRGGLSVDVAGAAALVKSMSKRMGSIPPPVEDVPVPTGK